MDSDLYFRILPPAAEIASFVESFWMLENRSNHGKTVIILPDGRVDLTFSRSAAESFHITLSGLETHPDQAVLDAGTTLFAISFKLPACEYMLQRPIAGLIDYAEHLPSDFWGFGEADLENFEPFCQKATRHICSKLPESIDPRKQKLFERLYAEKGDLTVHELAESAAWSSRQINRYFTQQFGLSLKSYCNILRFRASFDHIKAGKLFPEENFADQSHFIREVKKLSGVSPKMLRKNKDDRFIQFSTLKAK